MLQRATADQIESIVLPSYANTKPVVLVEELVRWLRERPADASDL